MLQIEKELLRKLHKPTEKETSEYQCSLYKGDNEKVLNQLATSHTNKIDFCYIDPPYNTKSKFIYDDKRISPLDPVWGTHNQWMQFMKKSF